jgi:hypothetical protein
MQYVLDNKNVKASVYVEFMLDEHVTWMKSVGRKNSFNSFSWKTHLRRLQLILHPLSAKGVMILAV